MWGIIQNKIFHNGIRNLFYFDINIRKIYLKSFSQSLRHPENKPLISHKEALNINEVLFGYGERKYMEEN